MAMESIVPVMMVRETRDVRGWRKRRSRHSMTSMVLGMRWCNQHKKDRDRQKGADEPRHCWPLRAK
jgi:hypothetical protein